MTELVADRPPLRPALRRRTERRLVAGVAGGLADWLNASPFFVRVVVGLAIEWQPAMWAYAAASLILPPRGRDRPTLDNLIVFGRVGVLVLTNWLLRGAGDVYMPVDGAPAVVVSFYALLGAGLAAMLSADYVRGRARTAAEERATVLGVAPLAASVAVVVAGVVLVDDVRWERWLPACVLVAGAALLVAAWSGRPRPFLAPAVTSVALIGGVIAAGVRLEGGVGDTTLTPTRVDGGRLIVRRAVGNVYLDLRRTASRRPVVVRVSVGKGDVRMLLPDRKSVVVNARVGRGELDSEPVNSPRSISLNGRDLEAHHRWPPAADGPAATLAIRVVADVGLGSFKATRSGGIVPFEIGP
jgi:phage shock protein PspC (stress-responsive transcriptional regulator)